MDPSLIKNNALDFFLNQRYNCAQSVILSFSEYAGISKELALKVSAPFGGGIARSGKVCGAVSGALIVIGLLFTPVEEEPKKQKLKVYQISKEFLCGFKNIHRALSCRDLLGVDISTVEGLKLAEEKELFKKLCANYVETACELLVNLLLKYEKVPF